jgi:hypothetical protein
VVARTFCEMRRKEMSKAKLQEIILRLMENAKQLQYGVASASLKVHEGRVVSINYETTECTKKREEVKE